MENLKISVVTPALNSASTIRETIESVRSQDYRHWEHIVVDGGSRDETLDILKSFPHLQWTSEKDEGLYDAMNRGIARATGDAIVILNADDCFRPRAMGLAARALAEHQDWDALFGDVVFVDEAGKKIYQREEARYDYKVLLYGLDYICHQTLFVRRKVYDRLGGYRHKEFPNAADYEFKLRLGRKDCRVGHVSALQVNYRYHSRGQSADRRLIRQRLVETAQIRREYGNPGGSVLQPLYKIKRQLQKLLSRGKCDLVPGTWRLRSHLRDKTVFSSNAPGQQMVNDQGNSE